jgi:hypothetical protein
MKNTFLFIVLTFLTVLGNYHQAWGAVIFVDDNAAPGGDGQSWQTAYKSLQDALADANSSAKPIEIRVAQGIYKPDQGSGKTPGDREAAFQLKTGVAIYGGFAGLGAPDPNFRDPNLYDETILSGDLAGNDVDVNDPCDLLTEPTRAENSYHLVVASIGADIEADANTVLDGFIITAGNANGEDYPNDQSSGGGILIRWYFPFGQGPILTNCKFTQNSAKSGGGMFNDHSRTMLTNCTFSENFAIWGGAIGDDGHPWPKLVNCILNNNCASYKGGAIANGESHAALENCTLIANHAQLGGAIYNGEGGAILTNCTVIGNSAERGGAVLNNDGDVTMTNCVVKENSCTDRGGVVYLSGDDTATLTNCILTANSAGQGGVLHIGNDSGAKLINCTLNGNRATNNGGALYLGVPDSAIVTNCIFWSNTPQAIYPELLGNKIVITYNDVQGGWPGVGNIDADPCFVAPGYWDANGVWVDGDYHLLTDSPCIDAGEPNYTPDPNETDLDGNPRLVGPTIDMGAYEAQPVIKLDPNEFTFTGFLKCKNNNPATQTLTIYNAGAGTVNWQISYDCNDCNWLTAHPNSGRSEKLSPGANVTLDVNIAFLDMGTYDCNLIVWDPNAQNSPQIAKVKLNIKYDCFGYRLYPEYEDYLIYHEPNCWCPPPCGSGYQCDGDADGNTLGLTKYRVYTNDFNILIANWKKIITDKTLDPCADFDHKPQGLPKYRVYINDFNILVGNWKKTDAQLPGNCPRLDKP